MALVPEDGTGVTKVAVLLYNGAEVIDFAGPWEVFGTAGFLVHSVAPTPDPVGTIFGQKLVPDFSFGNSPPADILLVPGGAVLQYFDDRRMIGWIRDQATSVGHLMSVCTGAFLLQKAGLLSGQTVTATYNFIEDFASPDTHIVYDRRYVDNGKLITTAGLSAGIDGALHLVSKIRGPGVAQATALAMEYHWQPEGAWARAALADRFLPPELTAPRGEFAGARFSLISTDGTAQRWRLQLLFSEPKTGSEVLALLRSRIEANKATGGIFKPTSHIKTAPVFAAASDSRFRWHFGDDSGGTWKGIATVEQRSTMDRSILATLEVERQG